MKPRANLLVACILALFFLPTNSQAEMKAIEVDVCEGVNIHNELKRPLFPRQLRSAEFTFKFEFRKSSDRSQPVAIFVPSPRSGTSIGTSAKMNGIPTTYGLILTDSRGAGCNRVPPAPVFVRDEFYESTNFAADLIAVIQILRLVDYILYANPSGAELATEVGNLLQQSGLPAPRAIILEPIP